MYYDIYILGYLLSGPSCGYDIKKSLVEKFDACTTINNNTLYPILKKYEKMGAIVKKIQVQKKKPTKYMYEITNKGKEIFIEILNDYPESMVKNRDEYIMRLYYFNFLDKHSREKILNLREDFLQKAINRISTSNSDCTELNKFHLNLLESELELINQMRKRIDEPCIDIFV